MTALMTALRSPSDRPQIAAASSIAWQGGQEEGQEEHVGEREGQRVQVTKRRGEACGIACAPPLRPEPPALAPTPFLTMFSS
jgi:hypothetical protein